MRVIDSINSLVYNNVGLRFTNRKRCAVVIQKIRNSLLLQLICIVLAILVVLTATLYTSFIYVKDTTLNYSQTLADSLLRQTDDVLSFYEENLRYNAESLCRFMIADEVDMLNDIDDGYLVLIKILTLPAFLAASIVVDRINAKREKNLPVTKERR